MTYSIRDFYPTRQLALPDEAPQIEAIRTRLMLESEEIRLGNDSHPDRTAARLARAALYLANSGASPFERVATLNEVHANLLAGGTKRRNVRTVAGLSHQALISTYPDSPDQATSKLNQIEIAARHRAIERTTRETPFSVALEDAWAYLGHPIGPLIEVTEEKILETFRAGKRKARKEQLSTDTGVVALYDPLLDEEEDPVDIKAFMRDLKI
jgi:hypothetical protein